MIVDRGPPLVLAGQRGGPAGVGINEIGVGLNRLRRVIDRLIYVAAAKVRIGTSDITPRNLCIGGCFN